MGGVRKVLKLLCEVNSRVGFLGPLSDCCSPFTPTKFALLASAILLIFSGAGLAQSGFKERLLNNYLQVAFTSQTAQLTKPEVSRAANLMIQCAAKEGCETTISKLNSILVAPWIAEKETKAFDPKNLISVILFSDPQQDDQRLGQFSVPERQQGQEIYEEGTTSCNVRAYHVGHTINRVVVYTDQTMGMKKTVSCILIELARATGLNIGPKFQKQWEQSGPLALADDKLFDQSMRGIERLLAVHFQKGTTAGMSKPEVEELLDKLTTYELVGE